MRIDDYHQAYLSLPRLSSLDWSKWSDRPHNKVRVCVRQDYFGWREEFRDICVYVCVC